MVTHLKVVRVIKNRAPDKEQIQLSCREQNNKKAIIARRTINRQGAGSILTKIELIVQV